MAAAIAAVVIGAATVMRLIVVIGLHAYGRIVVVVMRHGGMRQQRETRRQDHRERYVPDTPQNVTAVNVGHHSDLPGNGRGET